MPKKARALTAVGDDDGMAESMDNPVPSPEPATRSAGIASVPYITGRALERTRAQVGAESRQVGDEGRGGAFDVEGPSGPGPSPEGAGEMMDQMGMMDDDHEEHADGAPLRSARLLCEDTRSAHALYKAAGRVGHSAGVQAHGHRAASNVGHEDDMHEIFELGRYVLLQGTNVSRLALLCLLCLRCLFAAVLCAGLCAPRSTLGKHAVAEP